MLTSSQRESQRLTEPKLNNKPYSRVSYDTVGYYLETLTMEYFMSILPLRDGSTGFRFQVFGVQGLFHRRAFKKLWNIGSGETCNKINFGKNVLYIQKSKPSRHFARFAG